MTVKITARPFDPNVEIKLFAKAPVGGVVSFLGSVRNQSFDKSPVLSLTLEHYPVITERSIELVVTEAQTRWNLIDALIIHRVGVLLPGEPIVLVCTSADHRRSAFEACDFLMDYLKTKALFWKKETSGDGETWIEPRNEDYADARRWSE